MQDGFNCQQLAQMGPMEEEGEALPPGPAYRKVSLLGALVVKADSVVGVGDGANDAPVPLTGQAPLTGTSVVDPVDSLHR